MTSSPADKDDIRFNEPDCDLSTPSTNSYLSCKSIFFLSFINMIYDYILGSNIPSNIDVTQSEDLTPTAKPLYQKTGELKRKFKFYRNSNHYKRRN